MNSINDLLKRCDLKIDQDNNNGKRVLSGIYDNMPQEDYISIEYQNKKFFVYENHRNEKYLKEELEDLEQAVIWGIILYKKMNDDVLDREAVRRIRSSLKNEEEDRVLSYFTVFNKDILSIGKVEENKISLLKKDNNVSVVYNGHFIIENASLSRGYIALFNYCRKYLEILDFIHIIDDYLCSKNIDKQAVIEAYII